MAEYKVNIGAYQGDTAGADYKVNIGPDQSDAPAAAAEKDFMTLNTGYWGA